MSGKLGMTTTQRKAVLRNQASNLLWYGRLETTLGRAKELRPYAEKIITLAMNTYDDTVENTVVVKDKKGKGIQIIYGPQVTVIKSDFEEYVEKVSQ